MGSEARTSADTTNNVTNAYRFRDIGLTGAQFAGLAAAISRHSLQSQQAGYGALGTITQGAVATQREGFSFANKSIRDLSIVTESTLANITNATRDFAQRAISASSGQATPLQTLAGASGSQVASQQSSGLLIIGAAVVLVVLLSGK